MSLNQKLDRLILKLKENNNSSYEFFENIRVELDNEEFMDDAKQRLKSSYAITQYGNFTAEEERLLSELIQEVDS